MYIWYDGPVLYRYRTGGEVDYLLSSIELPDNIGSKEKPSWLVPWLVSPCKPETLDAMEKNEIDMRTASLGDTGIVYWLIEVHTFAGLNIENKKDWIPEYKVWQLASKDLPSEYMVEKGVMLHD